MAFPEDTEYPTTGLKAARPSSITDLSSLAIIGLVLQFIVGIIALFYALPGFIFAVVAYSIISGTIASSSYYAYLIIWILLSIVGFLQIHAAYRLYKMTPDIINSTVQFDCFAILLFGIDTAISIYENILAPYPEVILYLAINIVVVILLLSESVRKELDFDSYQSNYQLDT